MTHTLRDAAWGLVAEIIERDLHLRAIDEVNGNLTPEASVVRDRLTASTMRRAGYSDEEIVSELGYLPESFSRQLLETDFEAEPISSPGMR